MIPAIRRGTAVCHRSGDRWLAEVRLQEGTGTPEPAHQVFLNRAFVTEAAARTAGEHAAREWEAGRISTRDLMLQELAAVYRRLREQRRPMQPPTVPATQSAWESAFDAWEHLGWIAAEDAARYRGHVRLAFAAESMPVRRHRLPPGESSDPLP